MSEQMSRRELRFWLRAIFFVGLSLSIEHSGMGTDPGWWRAELMILCGALLGVAILNWVSAIREHE